MSDVHDREQPVPSRPPKTSASSVNEDADGDAQAEESREPRACIPCHGTGKVISNLGGHARKVTCPWCRGGGERLVGEDAQEFQREQAGLKRR